MLQIRRRIFLPLAYFALACVVSVSAQADLIRITPTGTSVSEQDATGLTSPVPIDSSGFRYTFHGGGGDAIVDPVYLVIATPEGDNTIAPTISWSTVSSSGITSVTTNLGGPTMYNGAWNIVTGSAGVYDADSSKDPSVQNGNISVYEFIGFDPDGDDSMQYTNMILPGDETSWDVWVYTLVFTPDILRGEWAEFDATNLGAGSYVMGYGCTQLAFTNPLSCTTEGTTQSTPFTFAGYVSVPEPGTLSLLGVGLLGLGLVRRKRT